MRSYVVTILWSVKPNPLSWRSTASAGYSGCCTTPAKPEKEDKNGNYYCGRQLEGRQLEGRQLEGRRLEGRRLELGRLEGRRSAVGQSTRRKPARSRLEGRRLEGRRLDRRRLELGRSAVGQSTRRKPARSRNCHMAIISVSMDFDKNPYTRRVPAFSNF